jgi:APA family basic amino acid/polyamine antiporter
MPKAPRPQPAPLYPLTPILFVVAGLGIVANTFYADWNNARIGALIIAAGAPVFFLWRRYGKSEKSEKKEG